MYLVTMAPATGRLVRLQLIPTRIRRFRINKAAAAEVHWLQEVLTRESKGLGICIEGNGDQTFIVRWPQVGDGHGRSD